MNQSIRQIGLALLAALTVFVLIPGPSAAEVDESFLTPSKERTQEPAERIPGHYIVVLKDSVAQPRTVAVKQIDQRDGELGFVYSHAIKGYSAELSKDAVESLRKSPNVRYVVPDQKVEALDQTIPTGIERALATENEVADIDGNDTRVDVDVAVIDTGVDHEHPDLNVVSRTSCVPEGANGSLSGPRDTAVDPEGSVWVADTGNDRIQEFNSAGEYLSGFGSSGTGPGQLDLPSGVATDSNGNVWVADTLNNRIQEFSPEGKLLLSIGKKGTEPGQLKTPWDVAVDAKGNIWVADSDNHRIQKFNSEGKSLLVFGKLSSGSPSEAKPSEFFEPSGIAIDAKGKVWVADSLNHRIQVFDPEGKFLFTFGKGGSGNGQLSRPRGIAFDSSGNVWVADQENNRVQKFDSEGKYLAQFGEVGGGPGQFGTPGWIVGPIGLAINSKDEIFVADPENNRVHKWSAGPPPAFSFAFGYGCIVGAAPDGHGHGTHVAGTIGAIDDGEGVVGVAPGARIWAVRVLDDKGSGSMSWTAAGIDWVTATREDKDPENDIEVANMSLGCACAEFAAKPVEEAISGYQEGEQHIPGAVDKGVVVVVAAGNSAADAKFFTPAKNPDAITVSALADYDGEAGGLAAPLSQLAPKCEHEAEIDGEDFGEDDTIATFSNWGAGVDIAAPGVCTYSTLPGGKYGYNSGTSMASPHVAGAAALLASQSGPDDKKDVEAIRNTLVLEGSLDFSHTAFGPPAPLLYLDDEPLKAVEVATGGAEAINSTSATIHGAIKPQGLATKYTLEYGTTTSYGKTVSGEVKAGESFARVSAALSGLSSDTEYHLRLKATNSAGTFFGKDETFTTWQVAFTTAATELSESSAILQGAVYLAELKGESTTYSFEYGTSTDYGQSIVAEIDKSEPFPDEWAYGTFYDPIAKKLTGLDKATVYHYRAVATNAKGTFYGRDVRFRTAGWTNVTGKEDVPFSIDSLSCVSANACMAVRGAFGDAAWWDGTSWKKLPWPTETFDVRDVSCVSATYCMLVGFAGDTPKAVSWDGKQWNKLPAPPLPPGTKYSMLEAVTCTSVNACVAVGSYIVPVVDEGYLALHWDGKEWSVDDVPDAPPAGLEGVHLTDVECISATSCFAVGWRTLHWDGEEWSHESLKSIGIDELSCPSSSFCLGVHKEALSATAWNGKEWLERRSIGQITRPIHWARVLDVSCATEWSCVAVGRERNELFKDYRIALRWDGTEWAKEAVSNPTVEGELAGVFCDSPAHCMAVGTTGYNEGGRIETYDQAITAPTATTEPAAAIGPSSATLQGTIGSGALRTTYYFEYDTSEYKAGGGPHGTKVPASPKLAGSSAAAIKVKEAIGGLKAAATYHYRVVATNAEGTTYGANQAFTTWGSWSTQSTPNPALPPNPVNKASLEAVSCPSTSLCLAAGFDTNSGKGFGQRWNGSEWKAEANLGSVSIKPLGISCPTSTTCFVAGSEGTGSASVAAAQKWFFQAGPGWLSGGAMTVPQPEGGSFVALNDVSCSSESACTAVGSYSKESKTKTLAVRWNGTSWSIQSSKDPESGSAELLGVSCEGASSCTAVGKKGTETFAQRWNGTSWSISSTPNPSPSIESILEDVSCTSASNCLAVGAYRESSSESGYNKKTLTERWNGTSWSIVKSPNPATHYGASLLDVSCTSSSACTAVGRYVSAASPGSEPFAKEEKTLVESWGGSEWAIQSSPNPEGKKFSKLLGVSCAASNNCKAVGSAKVESDVVTLGEGWNGTSWSTQSTPNPALPPNPVNKASLEAVSCPSTSLCLAAGFDTNSGKGFGQRWNGSEWKAEANLGSVSIKPLGISCPTSTTCFVAGSEGTGSASVAAAQKWFFQAGPGWLSGGAMTVPQPEGGSFVALNDVSCSSESACTAVGSYSKESKTKTLAVRWNGTSWSIQSSKDPESGSAELLGVSCEGASSCTAVGKKGTETFAQRWNGTSWSISSTPNPSPSIESILEDVSCTSASNCLAVGAYRESSSESGYNKKTLTERWNGTSWSIVKSPNPATHYGASLLDVSCTSSSACTAVGRYVSAASPGSEPFAKEEKTLVESWGGSEWAIQSSPNPEGKKFSKLLGVSCAASNNCKAVGSAKVESDVVTLGERYE